MGIGADVVAALGSERFEGLESRPNRDSVPGTELGTE